MFPERNKISDNNKTLWTLKKRSLCEKNKLQEENRGKINSEFNADTDKREVRCYIGDKANFETNILLVLLTTKGTKRQT